MLLLSINEQLVQLDNSTGKEDEEEIQPEYTLLNLAGNWDKTYLTMTAFAHLQNSGSSNRRKISYLFEVINYFLDDEQLYKIGNDYDSSFSEDDDTLIEYSDKEFVETETPVEDEDSTETQSVEKPSEEINQVIEAPKSEEIIEQPKVEITYKEYRGKLLEKFSKRYGIVVSRLSASR